MNQPVNGNSTPIPSRPLSPNIQIYRPQLTSVLSIANRITGVILSLGAVGLVIWLGAAADGPRTYSVVRSAIGSWAGQVVLFGCTFAFFPAFVRWHPSSRLGHRPRLRTSVDLHFGMDGRGVERGAHCGGMGDQPVCREVAPMSSRSFRSPLARALGLGAAKSGVRHWWAERVTAVALVPLCLWFVASIIAHSGSDYPVLIAWIRTPLATGCMVLLLIALFHHSALGLQVVIEDYVHSGVRFAEIVAIRLGCYGLAVIGIIATLHLSFDG